LLNNIQTAMLIQWCKHKALMGEPYTWDTLSQQVMALSGRRKPRQKWVAWFLQRHSEELEAGKGRGLDPKREKAFCKPVVMDHFKKLGDILRHYEIPPKNIYNKDEKGLQLGGGRKNIGTQLIFPHRMKHRTIKHSDDLQLVSVLEAVSADGTAVPTLMVLPKGSKPGAWWAHENEGLGG
ncbi:hypothetical protein K439DRAFT_1374007, partial [Ramaria rubella]